MTLGEWIGLVAVVVIAAQEIVIWYRGLEVEAARNDLDVARRQLAQLQLADKLKGESNAELAATATATLAGKG